jgi:beta-1,4-N-acetylglucosaminyltransferase
MKKENKIAIVGSAGGHITELNMIFTKEVIGDNKVITMTEKTARTKNLKNTYFFKPFSYNPLPFIPAFFKFLIILKKEKPKLVVSSGAEITVPAFFAAKFLGIKTIFIDDTMRVKTPTLSGKICYFFSDYFFVQYPSMIKYYGRKTLCEGGII